jgi:hypothetical protein
MNENIPPIPPAPQPPSYPSHEQSGPIPGNEPPYGPPQPYAPAPPAPYGQQPYPQPQYAPYPQQQSGRPKAKSSGFRVASGIIGIVLGAFLLMPSIAGFGHGGVDFMAFLILVAALGNITAGIVLLANQRGRSLGPLVTSLAFAGLALLLGLIGLAVPYYGGTRLVFTFLLASHTRRHGHRTLAGEARGARRLILARKSWRRPRFPPTGQPGVMWLPLRVWTL